MAIKDLFRIPPDPNGKLPADSKGIVQGASLPRTGAVGKPLEGTTPGNLEKSYGKPQAPAVNTKASPSAATKKANSDAAKPSKVITIPKPPDVFDYATFTDVDPYIEIVGYDYERFLQGQSAGRTPTVVVRLPLLGPIQSGYQMNYTSGDTSLAYDALVNAGKAAAQAAGMEYRPSAGALS